MFQGLAAVIASLGRFWSGLVEFFRILVRLILDVFHVLASVIIKVFVFFRGLFFAVGKFLIRSTSHFFNRILPDFFRAVRNLFRWIEARLAPIIKFLKRVRDWYDRFFNKYVAPVLKLISTLRKITTLLRLAGLKQAEKLDKFLRSLQSNIAKVFIDTRRILNSAIDLLNAVQDPLKLARVVVLAAAGRRAAAVLVRATTGLPIGFFFPAPVNNLRPEPPGHERATCKGKPSSNPPVSNLLEALGSDPALGEVSSFDAWPGVDVDALEPIAFFDDSAYDVGDADAAHIALVDSLMRTVERGVRA